jgi:DNA mismatch endonuclease (patch repair protein)
MAGADRFSPQKRSAVMRAVKSADTTPERAVRAAVAALGRVPRLHRADLPGRPDLAFIGAKRAIFVHGCFWHGHDCPRGAREPKANADYWRGKIAKNRARDAAHLDALAKLDFRTFVIWECETKDHDTLRERIATFLGWMDEAS